MDKLTQLELDAQLARIKEKREQCVFPSTVETLLERVVDECTSLKQQLEDARELPEIAAMWAHHNRDDEVRELRAMCDELAVAGRAVLDQWDTPNWKITEYTSAFINGLRLAVKRFEDATKGG